jgi:SAM-dependent methyltransferase
MHLGQIVPFGRSRQEYELMFDLTEADCQGRILGCGDGPASFNAEMTQAGYSVISIDPIYQFSGAEIKQRFLETVDNIIAQVEATPQNWVWSYHRDPEDLRRNRTEALTKFLADYEPGLTAGRYRLAALPELPFADREFDLALCSHLLFLYSDLLSAEFHQQSILELCRVTTEVRIFPLLTLSLQMSPHLEPVREMLAVHGIQSEITTTSYELQKGGNQMMRLFR